MKKTILIYSCISISLLGLMLYEKSKKRILENKKLEENLLTVLINGEVVKKKEVSPISTGCPLIRIHSKSDALSLVESQLGDNGGDWTWSCLWNDDEKFFVKAISQTALTEGAMTGTAYTVYVYRDGSIKENMFDLK